MATAEFRACYEMPVKVLSMANIALSGEIDHRSDYGRHDDLEPGLDIPPGAAAERRIRATRRIAALGEMTGGVAHDFRNILAIVESALRLAEKNSEAPEKVSAYISTARDGVARGLQLVSGLLAFASQEELEASVGNVNELLGSLDLFLKYGAGPTFRILLDLAPDIPECVVDPSQFDAAMLNLVINARDAMPNGGDIRISTERWEAKAAAPSSPAPGIYVRVRVRDSGHGMPAEVVQKIFSPHFTTKGEKGAGLGLPQVHAFMRLIGGQVRVVSEVGVGTTFDLLFPQASKTNSTNSELCHSDEKH